MNQSAGIETICRTLNRRLGIQCFQGFNDKGRELRIIFDDQDFQTMI